jgi:peptidoglycan/LPS O-acetylase OafA/YrhL
VLLAARWSPAVQTYVADLPLHIGLSTRWLAGDFVAHLFMLHGLRESWDFSGGNEVYWTLAREEYFYLLYIPLLFFRRTRGLALAIAMVFLVGLLVPMGAFVAQRKLHFNDALIYPINMSNSAIALWSQWALGMVAVEACFGSIRLPRWLYWFGLFPCWIVLGWINRAYGIWQLSPVLFGLAFMTLINWCVDREKAGRWPVRGIVHRLSQVGVFSYSLYLIHLPVIRALCGVEHIIRTRLGISIGPVYYAAVFSILVVLACAAGWLFFYLVERHFLRAPRGKVSAAHPELVPVSS